MFLLVYIFFLVATIWLWYQKSYGHRNKLLAQFAAPKSYPVLNHLPHIIGKSPAEIFKVQSSFNDLWPVWRLDLTPFLTMITINDPKIAEELLTSSKLIDKAVEYDMLHKWFGEGLIFSTGSKWHQRRKMITPAFHFKILEQFVEIMERNAKVLVEKLARTNGQRIDFFDVISLYTLDVICESAMGYKLNSQLDASSEYVKAVKETCAIFFQKFFNLKNRIPLLHQFTKLRERENANIKKLHEFTYSVIKARRDYIRKYDLQEESTEQDDFGIKKRNTALLDLLLKVKVNGEPLSDADIQEEVDTFMFAGHDTTSSALAQIFLNLARNPDIQQKVYEECKEVFLNEPDRSAKTHDFAQLTYLDKVIKETLRLHPSVPVFSRRFREDVKLGDYIFPANVTTKVSAYAMGRNPKYFPDPLKFDPSRFDNEKNIKLFSYIPFSAGPRNCIGQKYAILEMKSVTSKVIQNFLICVEKMDENPVYAQEIVLRPINGIFLSFKPRNKN